jgi:aspartyl/asparaginyl-tRNA synthetase
LDKIYLQGWISNLQKFGNMLFMHVNDGRSPDTIQVVLPRAVLRKSSTDTAQQPLTVGSAVEVSNDKTTF